MSSRRCVRYRSCVSIKSSTTRTRHTFAKAVKECLKQKLEDLSKDPAAEKKALAAALRPAETTLADQQLLGGSQPAYADYILFGTLMWPYQVCPASPLESGTNVDGWFNRLLDLNGGAARSAKRVMTSA